MRKILTIIKSRVFLYSFLILLQLAVLVFATIYLGENYRYFWYGCSLLGVIVSIYIVNTPLTPEYKIAWIVLVLVLPFLGIPTYYLLANRRFNEEDVKDKMAASLLIYQSQNKEVVAKAEKEDYFTAQMANYIYRSSKGSLNIGDNIKYYPMGEDLYVAMIDKLKDAKEYIFLEYFILRPGKMLDGILAVLKERIEHGVRVFLLYDDLGCAYKLPNKYLKKMKDIGINTQSFERYKPFISKSLNNRNHRKLCIIDGRIAFTGGINISDEYINLTKPFGVWKDVGISVEGNSVKDMVLTYIHMWNRGASKEEKIEGVDKYIKEFEYKACSEDYSIFIHDSPHVNKAIHHHCYLKMVDQATKYVYISTPYLIINQELKDSLIIASQSGVDVRVMIPGIPDKPLIYMLTKAFAEQLVKNGVKVYRYKKGFNHEKAFVSDDRYLIVGTANLDYRSLYLHYEDSIFASSNKVASEVKNDYLNTLNDCEELTPKLLKESIFTRAWRALLRMLAPLL